MALWVPQYCDDLTYTMGLFSSKLLFKSEWCSGFVDSLLPPTIPLIRLNRNPKMQKCKYLSTDYFGTRQIIFGNNMNTIEMHLILSSPWLTDLLLSDLVQKMVSYSIHAIAEYNLLGSKIICRQISVFIAYQFEHYLSHSRWSDMSFLVLSIYLAPDFMSRCEPMFPFPGPNH